MQKQRILIVDDELHILELIRYNLTAAGFEVIAADNGEDALKLVREKHPDLMILDVMLPGVDGLTVCKHIKSEPDTCTIPVMLLTARGDEIDRVIGLELGADDYMVKPFGVRELVARVKAHLRRSAIRPVETEHESLSAGPIRIDPETYCAYVGEDKLGLTLKEFELLRILVQNKGKVLTRDQLLDKGWGYDFLGETRTVDVHIRHLRQKLGPAGNMIETVRGLGYMVNDGRGET